MVRMTSWLLVVMIWLTGCSWWVEESSPQAVELELWDYRQPLVGEEYAYQEHLLYALEEFTREHPHVSIRVRVLHWTEGREELQRALAEGRGPDIYRSLDAGRLGLQALMHRRETDEPGTAYWPAADSVLTHGDDSWGWPSWLSWEVWVANTAWEEEPPRRGWASWQRAGYSWGELGDYLQGQQASIDWTNSRIWELFRHPAELYVDCMMEVANHLLQLGRQQAVVRDVATAQQQRLDDFFRGVTPLTAPVTPFLARYLMHRIATRAQPGGREPTHPDLLWLPPPSLSGGAEFPWQVSAYHVFKVSEDQAHLRWASYLAAYLARMMGRWGGEHLGVIPALVEDLPRWSLASSLPLALRASLIRDLERETMPWAGDSSWEEAEGLWRERVLPGMLSMLGAEPLDWEELRQHLVEYQAAWRTVELEE